MASKRPDSRDGFNPGKIFVGGLADGTPTDMFVKYFAKYGEITDYVVMKDRETGRPRGFGFIEFTDPFVVDTVMAEKHVINGKQVDIKGTIPKGDLESVEFKTNKIFIGGIPPSVTEDDLKAFFSKYGEVVKHEIIRDHATQRSRGFGFVVFDSELVVDNILVNGNMIDMNGTQVEVKEARPKKRSNPAPSYSSQPMGYGSKDSEFDKPRAYGSSDSEFGSKPWEYGPIGNGPRGFGPGDGEFDSKPRGYGSGGSEHREFGLDGSEVDSKPRGYGPGDNEFGNEPWGHEPSGSQPWGFGPGDIEFDRKPWGYGPGESEPWGYGSSSNDPWGCGYDDSFGGHGGGSYGPPYRSLGGLSGRFGDFNGYGLGGSEYSNLFGEPSFGYPSCFSSFGGGGYEGAGYVEPGVGAGWSYGSAGGPYRRWAGFDSGSRYHPYAK